jgi:hypothetical protein
MRALYGSPLERRRGRRIIQPSFHRSHHQPPRGFAMSKGMDQKKQEKKKPEKTLKEKRAAKKEKKAAR